MHSQRWLSINLWKWLRSSPIDQLYLVYRATRFRIVSFADCFEEIFVVSSRILLPKEFILNNFNQFKILSITKWIYRFIYKTVYNGEEIREIGIKILTSPVSSIEYLLSNSAGNFLISSSDKTFNVYPFSLFLFLPIADQLEKEREGEIELMAFERGNGSAWNTRRATGSPQILLARGHRTSQFPCPHKSTGTITLI